MTNFIPTFLINTSEDFEKWVRKQPFYYKAFVIFLNNSEQFFRVIEDKSPDFTYRILFHPGLTGNSNIVESDLLDVEAIHNDIKDKPDFRKIDIPLITRANFLKRMKENDKNAVHFNHLGYRFYYAPYCNSDEFINDIPIFKKGGKMELNIDNVSANKSDNNPKITILTALTNNEYSSFRENTNKIVEKEGVLQATFKKDDNFTFDYEKPLFFERQNSKMCTTPQKMDHLINGK